MGQLPSVIPRLIWTNSDAPGQITTLTINYKNPSPPILLPFPFHITSALRRNYSSQPPQLTSPNTYSFSSSDFYHSNLIFTMPPKAAEKKPTTGGKAPAGKAPAEKKEAGKKTAAPAGEKKKRNKARKETYSSYIYKGTIFLISSHCASVSGFCRCDLTT